MIRRLLSSRLARRDERGAVAAMIAMLMVSVFVGIAAIAVDTGLQRVARRDMQALADVVALDLARELNGRSQAQLVPEANFANPTSAVRRSVARNDDTVGDDLRVEVDWGSYTEGRWNTAAEPPSAVKVVASSNVDYSFVSGSGAVSRTSYANASSTACYRLGSFVAGVRSDDSTVLAPLNELLGAKLDLVSYKALADTEVTLGELAATSRIGSPEELLTGTITRSQLLHAMVEVLQKRSQSGHGGGSVDLAVEALNAMLKASAVLGSVKLGNVLHVSPTDVAALDIGLNALDLVANAQMSNGAHFIDISNLWAGVAGLGSSGVGGTLQLISAAELACGRPNTPETVAKNSQISGNLSFELNLNSLNLDLGIGTMKTPLVTGSLAVELGGGTGQLVEPPPVYCGEETPADPTTYSVDVSTALATYRLVLDVTAEADLKVVDLDDLLGGNVLGGILGGVIGGLFGKNDRTDVEVKVQLEVGGQASPSSSTANLSIPSNDVDPVRTGTSVELGLGSIVPRVTGVKIGGKTVTNLGLVSSLTQLIVDRLTFLGNDFVEKSVAPLLDNLDQELVGPVARMVGLRFGGADVYAAGATCGLPRLSG